MKKIILIAIAATCIPLYANAKVIDYSKPYLKGNLGYAQQDYSVNGVHSTTFKGKGMIGIVGAGYSWGNNLRTELEFYLDDGISGKRQVGTGNYKSEIKTYAGLANIAYDFNNSSQVTPFLMAGLGFAKNRFEVHGVKHDGSSYVAKKNHDGFIYQLGAGLAFKLDKSLTLETGYRAMNKGTKSVGMVSNTGQVIKHSRHGDFQHSFLVGIRFSL